MSLAIEAGTTTLWDRTPDMLEPEHAVAAGQAGIEVVRYRKHFQFVSFRSRRELGHDYIGAWEPRSNDDRGTIFAYEGQYDWLDPLITAIRVVRARRGIDHAYNPDFVSLLAFPAGAEFPLHQDFGRYHKRSITGLIGTAEIGLMDPATAFYEPFTQGPGSEYRMQLTDELLTSTLHSIKNGPECTRQTLVI